MAKQATDKPLDGRRLRSERSRQAIIDAALALTEEGNLVPTAQQISDRAGVGIRSFFRHFPDMETLFGEANEQCRSFYESLFVGGDRSGTLEERVLHAVERHADAYETVKNTVLSAHAQRWRYAVLQKNYAGYQKGLRRDLDDWLPELEHLDKRRREAVDAMASFEMWNRLREHQGLSKNAAIELINSLILQQLQNK